MKETTKTTKQLKLVAGFSDGDDRTISIDNPKASISAAEVNALKPYAVAAIQGDKTGATMTGWRDAKVVETYTHFIEF